MSFSLLVGVTLINLIVHKLRVMTTVELHLNATYYAQHPALKSVYGKDEPVIGGKLFL